MPQAAAYQKFEESKIPSLSKLANSIPGSFRDIVKLVSHQSPEPIDKAILQNRKKLQESIRKFHVEAGTLTSGVSNKIYSLTDSETQILVSTHQPNLFPYQGVLKKIVLLHSVRNTLENLDLNNIAVDLFVIVDHDFMDELWVHLAQLPSMWNTSATLEIRLPVNKSLSRKMICSAELPSRSTLDYWRNQVKRWIIKSNSHPNERSRAIDNFNQFWVEVESAYSNAKTYGDFNSFLVSRIVNNVWKYPTLFVRLTDLSQAFKGGFEYLISNFSEYSTSLRRTEDMLTRCGIKTNVSSTSYNFSPLWLHCTCGSKARTKITYENDHMFLGGKCLSCNKTLQAEVGVKSEPQIPKELIHRMSPRAIPLLLLLRRELGITCYCSGVGQ